MAKEKTAREAPKDIDLLEAEPEASSEASQEDSALADADEVRREEPRVEPKPASPSKASEPLRLTPAEWSAKKGHTRPADKRLPQSTPHTDWRFAIANKLYGWAERAYHFQHPRDAFRISEADYLAALGAAAEHPTVPPHAPALTPEAAVRFSGFKPKPRAPKGDS
jgi:hypothetical protein